MKIKVQYGDTKDTKNYYDENLYVLSNYKKIIKNPKMKVKKITSYLLWLSCLILLFLLILAVIGFQIKSLIFKFSIMLSGMSFLYALVCLLINFLINKNYINTIVKKIKQETIEINDIGIVNDDGNIKIQINWGHIQVIVINKYSISVIPKNAGFNILIFISTKYKNEVIKGIKKYDKEFLLVNNSDSY